MGQEDVPGPSEDKQTREGSMVCVTAQSSQSQKSVRQKNFFFNHKKGKPQMSGSGVSMVMSGSGVSMATSGSGDSMVMSGSGVSVVMSGSGVYMVMGGVVLIW